MHDRAVDPAEAGRAPTYRPGPRRGLPRRPARAIPRRGARAAARGRAGGGRPLLSASAPAGTYRPDPRRAAAPGRARTTSRCSTGSRTCSPTARGPRTARAGTSPSSRPASPSTGDASSSSSPTSACPTSRRGRRTSSPARSRSSRSTSVRSASCATASRSSWTPAPPRSPAAIATARPTSRRCSPRPARGVSLPVLAEVVRSGFVESVHRGSRGRPRRRRLGRPCGWAHPDERDPAPLGQQAVAGQWDARSRARPLRRAARAVRGLALGRGPAHRGRPGHPRRRRTATSTTCSARRTSPTARRRGWRGRARADGPERVAMNCSGKHAAMLATAVVRGWPTQTYLDPEHPLQQELLRDIEERAGEPVAWTAVDGCGAPLFGLTLTGLARAVRSLVVADAGDVGRAVADAMRAFPEYVGGTGRDVTVADGRGPRAARQGRRRGGLRRGDRGRSLRRPQGRGRRRPGLCAGPRGRVARPGAGRPRCSTSWPRRPCSAVGVRSASCASRRDSSSGSARPAPKA